MWFGTLREGIREPRAYRALGLSRCADLAARGYFYRRLDLPSAGKGVIRAPPPPRVLPKRARGPLIRTMRRNAAPVYSDVRAGVEFGVHVQVER